MLIWFHVPISWNKQRVFDIIHPPRKNLTSIRGYFRLGGLPDNPRTDPQDRAWFGPHDRLFTDEESEPLEFVAGPEHGASSSFVLLHIPFLSFLGLVPLPLILVIPRSFRLVTSLLSVAFMNGVLTILLGMVLQYGAGAGTAQATSTGRTWT